MINVKYFLTSIMLFSLFIGCEPEPNENDGSGNKQIACLPAGLSANVIAFYPFSKGSLNDISGNNEHLVNNTTAKPSTDRNGNIDCAYQFDNLPNASEFLENANTTFLNNLNAFSVSLWYLAEDTTRADGIFETIISRDDTAMCPNRSGQWSIGLYDCRVAIFGRTNSVRDNFLPGNLDCKGELKARTDTWTHVVATFQKSSLSMSIYRNGVLQETDAGHANCGSVVPSYFDIGDLFIGKRFTGKVDDIIIYNKTLNAQEVSSLFNMAPCCQ